MIVENNTIKVQEEDKKVLLDLLRPKGKWIQHESISECSECRAYFYIESNYCPSCGADMRGEKECK